MEATTSIPITESSMMDDSESDNPEILLSTILMTIFSVVTFLVSSVLNTMFLVIFFRRPTFRSVSNRFLVNLTLTNLLSAWVLLPLVIAEGFVGPQTTSILGCHIMDTVATIVASSSVIATLLVAVDRYCAITDPLHYHMMLNNTRGVMMVAGGWLITTITAAAGLLGDAAEKQWSICPSSNTSVISWTHYQGYFVTVNVIFSYLFPLTLLVWLYLGIYRAAQGNSERARRSSLGGAGLDAVDPSRLSRPPSRTPSTRSTSSQIVTQLKHRISNASLFLYKEEARAAKISVLVIVLVVIGWTPYYTCAILTTSFVQIHVPQYIHQISTMFVLSNSALSSYIYFFRSRKFQREIRRLFGCPISRRTIPKRKSHLQLSINLENIPPSPTIINGTFESDNQYNMISDAKSPKPSTITSIFSRLFQKWFVGEVWQDHGPTCSTTSNSSSTDFTAVESECMLPKIIVQS